MRAFRLILVSLAILSFSLLASANPLVSIQCAAELGSLEADARVKAIKLEQLQTNLKAVLRALAPLKGFFVHRTLDDKQQLRALNAKRLGLEREIEKTTAEHASARELANSTALVWLERDVLGAELLAQHQAVVQLFTASVTLLAQVKIAARLQAAAMTFQGVKLATHFVPHHHIQSSMEAAARAREADGGFKKVKSDISDFREQLKSNRDVLTGAAVLSSETNDALRAYIKEILAALKEDQPLDAVKALKINRIRLALNAIGEKLTELNQDLEPVYKTWLEAHAARVQSLLDSAFAMTHAGPWGERLGTPTTGPWGQAVALPEEAGNPD